ncbi:MAG: ATP-binding protein, partial [Actinomycetota bacterium]
DGGGDRGVPSVEVLARRGDLAEDKREALLHDLVGQLEELSSLVTNLVELASEPPELEPTEIQLDELTQEAVTRAQRLAPQVAFRANLEESVVCGVPGRLERAIANLLDNAVKWSPDGGQIDVGVARGEVTVRDHGPGIDEQDLPYVFDRFYRAASARPMPGSGLGLAIVRQVAEEHRGSVTIERPDGGGTLVRLELPEVETPLDGPPAAAAADPP